MRFGQIDQGLYGRIAQPDQPFFKMQLGLAAGVAPREGRGLAPGAGPAIEDVLADLGHPYDPDYGIPDEIGNIIGVGTPSNRVSSYRLDMATEESGI